MKMSIFRPVRVLLEAGLTFFEGVHCSALLKHVLRVASSPDLSLAWETTQTAGLHELAALATLVGIAREWRRHYTASKAHKPRQDMHDSGVDRGNP